VTLADFSLSPAVGNLPRVLLEANVFLEVILFLESVDFLAFFPKVFYSPHISSNVLRYLVVRILPFASFFSFLSLTLSIDLSK
jgi:hypothetical protein